MNNFHQSRADAVSYKPSSDAFEYFIWSLLDAFLKKPHLHAFVDFFLSASTRGLKTIVFEHVDFAFRIYMSGIYNTTGYETGVNHFIRYSGYE